MHVHFLKILLSIGLGTFVNPVLAERLVRRIQFSVDEANISPQIVELRASTDSRPVSFSQLHYFISILQLHTKSYVLHQHDCKHFAMDLFNLAHDEKIMAQYIGVQFVNEKVGHALVAFPTTDRGLVYVDITPGARDGVPVYNRSFVGLAEGRPYVMVEYDRYGLDFKNSPEFFAQQFQSAQDVQKGAENIRRNLSQIAEKTKLYETRVQELRNETISFRNSHWHDPKRSEELNAKARALETERLEINSLMSQTQVLGDQVQKTNSLVGANVTGKVVSRVSLIYP